MIELILVCAYIVIGIGYAKTFMSLIKENDVFPFVMAIAGWPLFLVFAAFWNFRND